MKITRRGQLTIPKRLRELYGFTPGCEIDIVPSEGGLLIRRVKSGQQAVEAVWGILKSPGSTDDYIEEIRGR